MKNKYYLADGKISEEDLSDAYAKKEVKGERYTYWIKRATAGPDCPHLVNPWGLHYDQAYEKKYERYIGKRRYEYSQVPEEVFNIYLLFLKTRNERFYRQAERALD